MAIHVDPTLPVAPISLELWRGMIDAGLLEGARVELIDGMMTEMSPKSAIHDFTIEELTDLLGTSVRAHGHRLRVQCALTIGGSEPEPDLAVVERAERLETHPTTALLAIEVAVSSHRLDRGRKAELYAEAGIPEYWVVDVPGRTVEVRSVIVEGRYTTTVLHGPGATLAPAGLPDALVDVGALLR